MDECYSTFSVRYIIGTDIIETTLDISDEQILCPLIPIITFKTLNEILSNTSGSLLKQSSFGLAHKGKRYNFLAQNKGQRDLILQEIRKRLQGKLRNMKWSDKKAHITNTEIANQSNSLAIAKWNDKKGHITTTEINNDAKNCFVQKLNETVDLVRRTEAHWNKERGKMREEPNPAMQVTQLDVQNVYDKCKDSEQSVGGNSRGNSGKVPRKDADSVLLRLRLNDNGNKLMISVNEDKIRNSKPMDSKQDAKPEHMRLQFEELGDKLLMTAHDLKSQMVQIQNGANEECVGNTNSSQSEGESQFMGVVTRGVTALQDMEAKIRNENVNQSEPVENPTNTTNQEQKTDHKNIVSLLDTICTAAKQLRMKEKCWNAEREKMRDEINALKKAQKTGPEETRPQKTRPQRTRHQETRPQRMRPQRTRPQETRPQEPLPQKTKPQRVTKQKQQSDEAVDIDELQQTIDSLCCEQSDSYPENERNLDPEFEYAIDCKLPPEMDCFPRIIRPIPKRERYPQDEWRRRLSDLEATPRQSISKRPFECEGVYLTSNQSDGTHDIVMQLRDILRQNALC